MSIKVRILDFLGQPALLPLRERARAGHKKIVGLGARARMRVIDDLVPGMLSIVVPAYNVEQYIGECLESLLVQDYANIQVLVVDDGSPDRSGEIARRYARRDPRVQVVRQPNGGLSAARNAGVQFARGEFLAFLDSDDFVDRHAYREAIAALRSSGSDFSVIPYRREKNGTFPPAAPWIGRAHRSTRLGVTLAEFPDIMVNAVAWSKVYRRRFWDEHKFSFPVGLLYEDQAVSMRAFAAARSFDVLARVGINWRIRGDQTSITQQVISSRNIADHALAVRHSLEGLREFGQEDAVRARVTQILNNNLHEFLPNIRDMDEVAWEQFRAFLGLLVDVADDEIWDSIEARTKIMIGLCRKNERDLALRFLAAGGWNRDHFAGVVEGDRLIAEVPLRAELESVVPSSALRFGLPETALRVDARDIALINNVVRVRAVAHINHLRMDREVTSLRSWLVSPKGKRTELVTERGQDARAALGHTRRYADMSVCLMTASIPLEMLDDAGAYRLRFEMLCGGLRREAELTVDAHTLYALPVSIGGRSMIALESDREGTAAIAVTEMQAELVGARLGNGSIEVEVRSQRSLSKVWLLHREDRFRLRRSQTRLHEARPGVFRAEIVMPALLGTDRGVHEFSLYVSDADGSALPVHSSTTPPRRAETRVYVGPRRHGAGQTAGGVTIADLDRAVLITNVRLDGDEIVAEFEDGHLDRSMASGRARVGSSQIDVRVDRPRGSKPRLILPVMQDSWGLGSVGLPSGTYHLTGFDAAGEGLKLYLGAAVVSELPLALDHALVAFTLRSTHRGELSLTARPPLRDDEEGYGDRWRLVDWFATLRPSGRRSVVFRNLYGEAANDSALAVHRELQRRGSDLELKWAVRDHSVRVPDGATVLLEDSREYYEAFGTANYLMVNVHQPHWYRKPEGQVLIETFHGYPFKMNGRRWWRKLGFSPERQESFFRRAEEWDYLVSPARYATPLLKEFYREGAEPQTSVLEIGYPRNDALLDEHAGRLRRDTRERLGIPEGKRAILYAPTFRDYLSADDMTAKLVEFFDPRELVRQLGPEYVLLMRGHPFNARSGTKPSSSYINVTDYPDINHLILASDMAVLDYSSLRFDYALTGKPMFFFVPDLERYFDGRDSFAPYDDTSPGPHLRGLKDLVDAIGDATGEASSFEEARQRFVATYMELEDGRAAHRLVDAVFASRGDA